MAGKVFAHTPGLEKGRDGNFNAAMQEAAVQDGFGGSTMKSVIPADDNRATADEALRALARR